MEESRMYKVDIEGGEVYIALDKIEQVVLSDSSDGESRIITLYFTSGETRKLYPDMSDGSNSIGAMLRGIIEGIVGRKDAWDDGLQWKDAKDADAEWEAEDAEWKTKREEEKATDDAAIKAAKGSLDRLADRLTGIGVTKNRLEAVAYVGLIAAIVKYLI